MHLAANLLNPQYLSEDDLMTTIETVIKIAYTPDVNKVKVMSDIAEYRAKQKLWSREIIWKDISHISPTTW